ncbi:hypothetical protein BDR06DRAFT_967431 [Suillus hirtellus]|nr:hypothetical protein BDR06DRAFT_967431 [Suillus hirtellus]
MCPLCLLHLWGISQSGWHAVSKLQVQGCSVFSERRMFTQGMGASHDDTEDGEQAKGWKQLEEQMFQRLELLAVCYSKIGDWKNSNIPGYYQLVCDAFVESVKAFLYGSSSLERLASEVSLHTALKPGVISDEVLGLLLKHQISTLEPYLQKNSVQTIVCRLLQDTLSVYKATVLPLRRARVLL